MSRIDEALKRASHSPLGSRGSNRASDTPLRLADELTINEYPAENRNAVLRPEAKAPVTHTTPPQHRVETRTLTAKLNVEANDKLIVVNRNYLSTEQYRRLAATLHEAQIDKGLKSVLVTSAVPREGKTLTVVNLALTLSESYGRQVLLVDADLRRPSVHEMLGIPNEPGLSELLRSNRVDPPILQVSPRLAVLPAGRVHDNPLAGLSSDRMRTFLDEVSAQFQWVLLDTPPVGLLPDAQLLGRVAQAAVFVIRAGATPYAVVERAISELGRDCIIGTVLNGVEERTLPATSYYGEYAQKA